MMFLQTFWALLRRLLRRNMTDYTKANIAVPLVQTDKVIVAKSLSYIVTNAIGITSFAFNTGDNLFQTDTYGLVPFGIFSYDGGSSYNSFTSTQSTPTTGSPLPVRVSVDHTANNGDIRFKVNVTSTVGGGATIPIDIYVGLIEGINNVTRIYQNTTQYAQKTAYDSRNPVPRIAFSGSVFSNTGVNTIPHGLNTIPDVRLYIYDTNQGGTPAGSTETPFYSLTGNWALKIDSTNIYISTISSSGYIYNYEVYYT